MASSGVTLDKVMIEINASTNNASQNISRLAQTLSELRNATKGGSKSLSSLSQSMSRLEKSTSTFKMLGTAAKSMTSVSITGFKSLQKQNDSFFKSLSRNTASTISKIKQIGLSLLGTRTIFTATRKAVSEYMAMDADLTWKVTNNWRALGAQLSLAIENVTWLFKQFIRVIYSVILALTGIDLIARANEKAMKGWGKAAKDTLGNLQKFDDLNVVEFPKGAGAGDNKLIELDTIDLSPIQKVIDWVRKLRDEIKEAWNSGQWYGVGEVLAEGLNGAMRAIDFDWIEEKFRGIASKFGDFLQGAVDNFDWNTFGEKLTRQLSLIPRLITTFLNEIPWEDIGKGISDALSSFDPAYLLDAIFGAFNSLVLGIQSAFLQIDGSVLGKKIGDAVKSAIGNFNELLSKIEWGEIGTKIREVILGIDWAGIWNKVVDFFKEALSGIGDFIDGITGVSGLGKTLGTIGTISIGVKGASEVIGAFGKIKGAIEPVITAMSLVGKGVLSTETISGITGVAQPLVSMFAGIGSFLPIILAVAAGIALVVKAFKELYENNEAFRAKVNELIEVLQGTFKKVFEDVKVVVQRVIDIVKVLWNNILKPIIDLLTDILKPIIEALVDVLLFLWENVLDPIVSFLGDVFVVAFDVLAIAIEGVSKVVQGLIDVLKWLWDNILGPIVKFITDVIVVTIKAVISVVGTVINSIKDRFNAFRTFIEDLWEALKAGPKSFANFVIDKIEWLINKIISGVNWLIRLLNKFSFDVPDWVPGIGGKKMGFDIKEFSQVSLPRLETGTNEVPYEGMYHLHPGEAVIPKKYNPAIGGGTNEETNQRLDTLIDTIENQEHITNVYIGNDKVYKGQKKYNTRQVNKYGTIRVS